MRYELECRETKKRRYLFRLVGKRILAKKESMLNWSGLEYIYDVLITYAVLLAQNIDDHTEYLLKIYSKLAILRPARRPDFNAGYYFSISKLLNKALNSFYSWQTNIIFASSK